MKMKTITCILNLMLLTLLAKGSSAVVGSGQGGKSVMCFFEGVSTVLQDEEARFEPEDLDVTICTHLVYFSVAVDENLGVWLEGSRRLPPNQVTDLLNRTLQLKIVKPGLKVFIDVDVNYRVLKNFESSDHRSGYVRFAQSAADFLEGNGFDGMHLQSYDSQGFKEVAPVLHEEFARRGLILMTTFLTNKISDDPDMAGVLSRNFDLVAMQSYYRIPLGNTKIHSSLKVLGEVFEEHVAVGIPAERLVVPIPAFAFSVRLCDIIQSGLGAPACGLGDEGMFDGLTSSLRSWELQRKMANSSEGWVVVRDEESKVQYGHSRSLQWASFEDPVSVRAKADFILKKSMAGAAIVNVDRDDFRGRYSEGGVTFPLTRAAYNALNGGT